MILNFTPHAVVINGTAIPSTGNARCSVTTEPAGFVNGIPLVRSTFGAVEGLPDQADGVWLIVSRLVASALPNRADLLVPAGLVRDNQGRVIGCTALEVNR